ncbi:hypothetical protein B4113_0764 [Geobacillus sp. B4113_201601]|nr:hypothetical protein B4113_0764 [Geobacillus sp. B4113_201601]
MKQQFSQRGLRPGWTPAKKRAPRRTPLPISLFAFGKQEKTEALLIV